VKKTAWTPQEQKVALFTAVCAVVGLVVLGIRSSRLADPLSTGPLSTPVNRNLSVLPKPQPSPGLSLDLNRATEGELSRIPAIGTGLAHAIVQYRASHGGFRSLDEIRSVRGSIGPKRYGAIVRYLKLVQSGQPNERETQ